jgi:hypothetical protein
VIPSAKACMSIAEWLAQDSGYFLHLIDSVPYSEVFATSTLGVCYVHDIIDGEFMAGNPQLESFAIN